MTDFASNTHGLKDTVQPWQKSVYHTHTHKKTKTAYITEISNSSACSNNQCI